MSMCPYCHAEHHGMGPHCQPPPLLVELPADRYVEGLKAALRWYADPGRYTPRFEGVGHAGSGPDWYSQADTDLGRIARAALGEPWEVRIQEDVEHAKKLLKEIRTHHEKWDAFEAHRKEQR